MKRISWSFIIIGLLTANLAYAFKFDGVALSAGHGEGAQLIGGRLALRSSWNKQWLLKWDWAFQGHWEASYAYLHDYDDANGTDSPHILAFTPVFRYQKASPLFGSATPFIELAIGVSFFSETEADGRDLSTTFQFEDRAGAGFRFGDQQQYELKYNFFHYSNGSIESPNQGVNMQWLTFAYYFR